MPPEPKKPIEKLLEASAQARRAEFGAAEPQMPNPMRARLQDEVARQAQAPERPARAGWWGVSFPRLVLGTAFAAVVAGGLFFWWQAEERPAATASFAANAAPPVAAAPAEAESREELKSALAKNEARRRDEALETAKAAPAAAEPAWQNFRQSADRAAGLTQNFAQAARAKSAANQPMQQPPPASRVLDNFQVQQTGRAIRVVDEDGSTYTGEIEPLAADDKRSVARAPASARSQEAAADAIGGAQPQIANEFHFRAQGFNSRLQKPLTFEGNYIVGATAARAKDQQVAAPEARIVGTARVAGEAPMRVDAIVVPGK